MTAAELAEADSAPCPGGAYQQVLYGKTSRVVDYYDALGDGWERWQGRSRYYRRAIVRLLRFLVPPGQQVLDIGCGNGDHLDALQPARGVGVDISRSMVDLARRKHPALEIVEQAAEDLSLSRYEVAQGSGGFDAILMVNLIGELTDVLAAFKRLRPLVRPDTRVVIVFYNPLWEPLMWPAAKLGLKLDNPIQNWLSIEDLRGLLHLAGFEIVKSGARMPCPKYIPGIAEFTNSVLGRVPPFHRLGFIHFIVARPEVPHTKPPLAHTCSVVVPCKNEEENVVHIPERLPQMGAGTELIFVDDRSTDSTAARVRELIERYPERRIILVDGPGEGKGAAVRAGLAHASGDVLMILDADMTVMPEDLPAFFEALVENRGEFVNGSRLVYPLGENAMRSLNIVGNRIFALLFTFLLEERIKDTLCGTKAVMRHNYLKILSARDYFGTVDRWGDYDWIFGAAKACLKIVELPVHYVERTAGVTKMTKRLSNATTMLRMCWLALRKLKLA